MRYKSQQLGGRQGRFVRSEGLGWLVPAEGPGRATPRAQGSRRAKGRDVLFLLCLLLWKPRGGGEGSGDRCRAVLHSGGVEVTAQQLQKPP